MSWSDLAEFLEDAVTVETAPRTLSVGVSEQRPTQAQGQPGQVSQRVLLMIPSGDLLDPPLRLVVRGRELRVIGTQAPPFMDAPSLVTCERVSADLPDEVSIIEESGTPIFDVSTGEYVASVTILWTGPAHVVSGLPSTVDSAGEDSPLDKVTITLPLAAPYVDDLRVEVSASRVPGLVGANFRLSGEVLDSGASLRRVIGYRQGV